MKDNFFNKIKVEKKVKPVLQNQDIIVIDNGFSAYIDPLLLKLDSSWQMLEMANLLLRNKSRRDRVRKSVAPPPCILGLVCAGNTPCTILKNLVKKSYYDLLLKK